MCVTVYVREKGEKGREGKGRERKGEGGGGEEREGVGEGRRGQGRRKKIYLLAHSSNDHNGRACSRLKPGA